MKRLSVIAIMLTALTGCTVTPGVYMSTSGKNVVDTGDRDISKFVDICSYPRNVDTTLSEVYVFKLFRTETATGTVTSPAIIITLDIFKYCRPHYFPVGKALAVNTFHLQ